MYRSQSGLLYTTKRRAATVEEDDPNSPFLSGPQRRNLKRKLIRKNRTAQMKTARLEWLAKQGQQ